MTQDQPGQAQGTDYVVRGEVVPDDETQGFEAEQSGPMTRLRKVASALRGDQADQTVPDQPLPDQTVPNQAVPDQTLTNQTVPNQAVPNQTLTNQTVPNQAVPNQAIPDQAVPMSRDMPDAARPDDVGAVRSPDAEDGDYWDEQDVREMAPVEGATASDPSMTGASTYGTTAAAGTGGTGLAPGNGSQADIAAGDGSRADTEAVFSSSPGTTQGYGSQAGSTPGYGTEAGTTSGYGSQAGTATDPSTGAGLGAAEGGIAESGPAGRHAAENAGLRPGEATDRLGDFGDIAFGNLLPDAAQYSAQWQQIQFRFVDDPQGSVTEAAEVVSRVTTKLEAAIQERQRAIQERQLAIQERASALRGRWGEGSNADTETLRETLRMYRVFMDQLIGPTSERGQAA
jgi:hypothetical protein